MSGETDPYSPEVFAEMNRYLAAAHGNPMRALRLAVSDTTTKPSEPEDSTSMRIGPIRGWHAASQLLLDAYERGQREAYERENKEAQRIASVVEKMPLSVLMLAYKDGNEIGWQAELKWLQLHDSKSLDTLVASLLAEGMREPILLGDDWRVWDGHHRICAAFLIGMKEVPVIHSKDL